MFTELTVRFFNPRSDSFLLRFITMFTTNRAAVDLDDPVL